MLAILAALLAAVAVLVPRLGWIGKLLSRYNARNIVVRWPITAMLLAAFTLQVGIVVVMLSFVRGLQNLTAGSSVPSVASATSVTRPLRSGSDPSGLSRMKASGTRTSDAATKAPVVSDTGSI